MNYPDPYPVVAPGHIRQPGYVQRLNRTFARLEVLLGANEALIWLDLPRPELNGAIPLYYLETEKGTLIINRIIDNIDYHPHDTSI